MALRFMRALFPEGSWLHMRAVPEPKSETRRPTNHWYQMGERFPEDLASFLQYCAIESRAAFFLPAIANPGKSHKDAVHAFTSLVVDFDRGNPAKSLTKAEASFDAADIVVESGGKTEHGYPKLHAYWKLDKLASTPAEIARVCGLRLSIAEKYNGDPCLKQEAQVTRVPGSIHFKNGPQPVRLIRCP